MRHGAEEPHAAGRYAFGQLGQRREGAGIAAADDLEPKLRDLRRRRARSPGSGAPRSCLSHPRMLKAVRITGAGAGAGAISASAGPGQGRGTTRPRPGPEQRIEPCRAPRARKGMRSPPRARSGHIAAQVAPRADDLEVAVALDRDGQWHAPARGEPVRPRCPRPRACARGRDRGRTPLRRSPRRPSRRAAAARASGKALTGRAIGDCPWSSPRHRRNRAHGCRPASRPGLSRRPGAHAPPRGPGDSPLRAFFRRTGPDNPPRVQDAHGPSRATGGGRAPLAWHRDPGKAVFPVNRKHWLSINPTRAKLGGMTLFRER